LISFMGAGQTLTSVISHHSFSSRWMTSNLVGLEIGDFNGDPYPDLVMAVDRLATSEKSSSVNFDVMLGSQKWTNKFDRYACVNAQAPPGRFGTIGGFIYQGRPGALAVVPLNDDNLADLLIGASGMGDPGNSNYIPDQVAVLMTEEGSDWTSEVGAESTVFYEQCVPGLALNDPETTPKVCLDDSDCWSFCLPDEDQQVTTVGLGPRAAVFGDVDNDGVTDALVVFVTSGDVALLRGSLVGGKYNLSSPGKPPQKLSLGVDPTDLTLGDLDADGWLDLVAVVGGSLAVSWGVDGTNFQVPQLFEKSFGCSSLHATRVETGDVDNDGRDDVVVMSKANNALYVYSSTGDKQLVGPTIYKTAAGPVDFEVHDMNQDGCADFVVAVEGTRSVSVILSKACE
jgi:hypothetical protein